MISRNNFCIILILSLLPITYSEAACTCSNKTVTRSNGVVKGDCMSESTGGQNPGQLYTYVKIDENPEECCEGTTASFRTYCINYSLCDCGKNPETCCSKKEKPAKPYPGYSIADLLIKTKSPG